ncbi:MAG TPA: AsmA-like C-terminal region-containing protein [Tepidisphaeraceae bacterium]|nr:AsmA-like C-terminal region-containing protein [Tepidisphaeraceae bacterium]
MPPKKGKKLRNVLIALAVLVGLTWFVGPRIAAPLIQRKLQAMVAKHLHAELRMDSLTYHFPYGLRAVNASLVTGGRDGRPVELIRVGDLELALAEIPWGSGPLVIEKIIIRKPVVNLIRESGGVREDGSPRDEGELLGEHIVRDDEKPDDEKKGLKVKPSAYFRLRYLSIEDGQVAFRDADGPSPAEAKVVQVASAATTAPNTPRPPVVWKGINVEIKAQPTSGAEYAWEMALRNAPVATANVRGKVDVDAATLDVEKFVLSVKVGAGRPPDVLPAALQEALTRLPVNGSVSIGGQAHVPLTNVKASVYELGVDVGGSVEAIPGHGGRIDHASMKFKLASGEPDAAGNPKTHLTIGLIDLTTGDTSVRVEKGEATLDGAARTWAAREILIKAEAGKDRAALPAPLARLVEKYDVAGKVQVTLAGTGPTKAADDRPYLDQIDAEGLAYARDVSFKPAKFDRPFTKVSGAIRLGRKAVAIENAQGRYDDDEFFLTSARIPLEGIDREVQIREVTGSARLSGKTLDYPLVLGKVFEEVRPTGTWYVSGNFTRKVHRAPGEKPAFWVDVTTDGDAGATISKYGVPLTNVKTEISVSSKATEVRNVEARTLGGTIKAEMTFTHSDKAAGKPLTYAGKGWVRDVDLKALKEVLADGGKDFKRLSGTGNANLTFDGVGKSDNQPDGWLGFRMAGKVDVFEGDFWTAPIVDDVVGRSNAKPDGLSTGQVRGDFVLKEKVFTLSNASVSSPLFGIQGDGTIGLDGKLDLRVIAAPLADWKDQMKATKVPVVSDVAGEILGAFQSVLNGAQRTLLYEFKVGGTVKDRKIEAVPAPVLTEGVAKWIRESTK